MPSKTAGRIAKAQRTKKPPGQQHQKNHRWESFSSKIAQLHSLDPLHKVRRHDLDADAAGDLSATTSYFRNGLERWTDLNLSRGFTAFRRAVSPLCDSLAQILHFEDRIMDHLAAAIRGSQGQDDGREALEPLLDLLAAFAHDLGSRFVARGYDARAFGLLVDVARHNTGAGIARSHHQQNHELDAAVIEWTFTCLTFLFKYLSKLLVADLRPTYDILSPLLGRPDLRPPTDTFSSSTPSKAASTPAPSFPRVPGHIARFTAEALSFLVRMTANPSRRDSAMPFIVNHIRDDLLRATEAAANQTKHSNKKVNTVQLYTQGIMTLFAESTKGPSMTLRLSSAELVVGMIRAVPENELDPQLASRGTPWSDVCCGVLTSIIHHANHDALRPVVDAILADAASETKKVVAAAKSKKASVVAAAGPWRLSIFIRLFGILTGVRGGAKIHDWAALVPALAETLEAMAAAPESQWPPFTPPTANEPASPVWRYIVANVAIVWNHTPPSDLRPQLPSLTKSLQREPLARWFVPFCAYTAELNAAKFHSTLQAPFQAFVSAHWAHDGNEDVLCAVLPDMVNVGAFPVDRERLRLPQSWQDSIVRKFEQLEATPFPERGVYGKDPATWRDHCLPKYAALLGVLDMTIVHPSTPARISELLLRKLKLALRPTSPQLANNDETTFIVTQGFRAYLRMAKTLAAKPDAGLRPLLRAAAPRFARRTGFLEALLQYEQLVPEEPVAQGETKKDKQKPDTEDDEEEEDPIVKVLVSNLSAPSHALRLVSLKILERIGDSNTATDLATFPEHANALANMLQTEDIGFAPHNVRNIAAHLRKLAQVYAHVTPGSWIQAAIPAFLFGMLSVPLAPVWDDAVKAMKQVAETNKAGEEAIATLAFDWLEVTSSSSRRSSYNGQAESSSSTHDNHGTRKGTAPRAPPTDFECFKLEKLNDLAQQTETLVADPSAVMLQAFQAKQEAVPAYAGYERGKALKVLAALPGVAEKRSRKLVPHLLSWTEDVGPRIDATTEDDHEEEEDGNAEDDAVSEEENQQNGTNDEEMDDVDDVDADVDAEAANSELGSWSFPDKKALIVVFSLFTNSQVLYQHEKAYNALLKLLANGDIEIQRLALKALLAWRQDSVVKYKEQLDNLLDESKFKNELTLLMQSDDENSANGILPEHRADLMPVLLRLLYGRTISKKGAASGRQGLHATRLFVIRNLDVAGVGGFLQVALGNLHGVRILDGEGEEANLRESIFPSAGGVSSFDGEDDALLSARKQVGVLNMLEPIINELGSNATPFLDSLVNATLYCLICACRGLQNATLAAAEQNGGNADDPDEDEDSAKSSANTSLMRAAKTAALRCLCALFRNAPDYNWVPFRNTIVTEVISPVIDRLPQETTQGVSWTWKLLSTWAQLPQCVLFLSVDARVLPKILESLAAKAKDPVKIHALSIVNSLVQLAATNEAVSTDLLMPNMDTALMRLSAVLRSTADGGTTGGSEINRGLLEACVDTVVALAPMVQATTHVRSLVDIATWLLNQPSRRVNPRVKGSLLLLLERFIQLDSENGAEPDTTLQDKVYTTISSLFSFFKDRENRQTLCRVLSVFAAAQTGKGKAAVAYRQQLQTVADLCFDLNSYTESQLDEPNYDRRLAAFSTIARPADGAVPLTAQQWLPILHNMLFFVRVDEEYGILSSNAADGLCKLVSDAANVKTHLPKEDTEDAKALTGYLTSLVLPAIYAGARDASETVRREIARTFGFVIATLRAWPPVADLAPLVPLGSTAEGDEVDGAEGDDANMEDTSDAEDDKETNRAFFSNILNPTIAKQIQAMQVLEGINKRLPLGSKNVSQFFIPFLEHFIFGREDGVDDRGLGAQATNTIAMLAYSLEWNQYRAMLRRFITFIETKPELQKQVVRLLDKVVDAVAQSAEKKKDEDTDTAMDGASPTTPTARTAPVTPIVKCRLAATLPEAPKLSDDILNNLTPSLVEHLHDKDEETVSARVPAAIILVKLLNLLPSETRDQRLAGVLTDVCHILRSKNWDSREMARETLSRISTILGSGAFGFVLKELRGALTRGYQLHVLSYTVHTLLLAVIPQFAQGDLDYCIEPLMAVIMDDVFGAVGEEKDADEYVSKMKEVKKSKSQDSLELIAKNTSVSQLGVLVQPLHMLMLERITKHVATKIDTLLARIAAGLAQNPAVAETRETLVFCYEIIQDVYRSRTPAAQAQKIDPRIKKFLFQKTERNNAGQRKAGKFTYKLIQFALDVLRTVLRKYDSLRTPENVSGFIPVLGDAVLVGEEEVKIAAYKLLVVLVKVPFPDMTAFSGLYQVCTKEAIKTISTATTTSGDLAQSALKLVSVVLRSRHDDVPVRSVSVDALLTKLKDDLTNPLYRHVTFNFVRAVLDRKIESAVVYDTLDYIGTVMITNDDQDTRDLARRAFFQFLREYPQRRKRWERQLEFIVANFKYEREGGRLSAMEIVYMLLLKATAALDTPAAAASDPFVQDIVGASFLPLVMVLANDESAKCRRVAGAQLTAMLSMAKRDYVNEFLKMFRAWLAADARADLGSLKMGLELFGVYFASFGQDGANSDNSDNSDIPVTALPSPALSTTQVQDIQAVIARVTALLASDKVRRGEVYSKLLTTALETVQTMVTKFPVLALDRALAEDMWNGIEQCLWHGTHAVRMAAMQLVGLYLADFARADKAKVDVEPGTSFAGTYGMTLDDDTVSRLVRGSLSVLSGSSGDDVDPVEAEEAAKMLVRLGQYLRTEAEDDDESDASDDEAEEDEEAGEEEADDDSDDDEGEVVGDDEAEDKEEQAAAASQKRRPIDRRYVLLRLARIVRRETPPKLASLVPKAAAMAVLEAFCSVPGRKASHPAHFASLSPVSVRAVLRPLRNLTDTSIPPPFSADPQFAPRYDELKLRAQSLMDVLQTRLGTAAYTQHLLAVGAATRDRRQHRATKRKIEAVAQPEKYGRDKRKKLDKKKERRKVRSLEHRGMRRGY
ncbi:U3 small nucleolar RNA-associated protein 20 [Sporothrix schenckii 1099-18]|uniref:U3 small nucleolar RNA-associated protein 20 n=1 Tax=Sporothrix schenckii 1099-18 TaxID=1397361 RepID=A0A0F2M2N0_SPOSC|nr:U3 small nucleolar RNA-associated protein 20 [Sporothrix schenckii 1099-18]KJR83374.1 U3 small nucleolar RNA-associated protein 20 [Sporothrix schenckii 1099-18]